MKKFFVVFAFAMAMICSVVTTANAQTHRAADPQLQYENCRKFVQMGDDCYRSKSFGNAKAFYEDALRANGDCPDKKYMSDRELNKKIDDCVYAMDHNNQTREEVQEAREDQQAQQAQTQQQQAGAALGALIGALINAASSNSGK